MIKVERILKALANRRRLAILGHLKKNTEASVGAIAAEIRLSIKATSRHLRVLTAADIVEHEQRGLQVFYRLSTDSDPIIGRLLSLLLQLKAPYTPNSNACPSVAGRRRE